MHKLISIKRWNAIKFARITFKILEKKTAYRHNVIKFKGRHIGKKSIQNSMNFYKNKTTFFSLHMSCILTDDFLHGFSTTSYECFTTVNRLKNLMNPLQHVFKMSKMLKHTKNRW